MNSPTDPHNTPPDLAKWWRNKRRLAWFSFGLLAGIVLGVFLTDIQGPAAQVLVAACYACMAIIGTYIGFSAWDDMNARNK